LTSALEGVRGQCQASAAPYPRERPRYPLCRRQGGPQGRSGHVWEILPPPGFDPRTVQPIGSRYIDYATRPTRRFNHIYITNYKCVVLALFSHCPYSHALIFVIYFRNLSPRYLNLYIDYNGFISHTLVILPNFFPHQSLLFYFFYCYTVHFDNT
jgi:hypothetical protein